MPLQNRVDPFGGIHAVDARGLFTGNRGILHDPDTRTLHNRRWTNPAWIICVLDFQGRRREPMGRNGRDGGAGWTELFFLDEVTALAAGHRPCFYCQRQRAKAFLAASDDEVGQQTAPALDRRLHGERLASTARQPTIIPNDQLAGLPDGAMVADGDAAFAVREGRLMRWTFNGYAEASPPRGRALMLVTPATSLGALMRGYEPVWHPTASAPLSHLSA